jgi:hypothetical protein
VLLPVTPDDSLVMCAQNISNWTIDEHSLFKWLVLGDNPYRWVIALKTVAGVNTRTFLFDSVDGHRILLGFLESAQISLNTFVLFGVNIAISSQILLEVLIFLTEEGEEAIKHAQMLYRKDSTRPEVFKSFIDASLFWRFVFVSEIGAGIPVNPPN